MKVKYLWVALLSLTFWGCDDNTGTLGLGMFPGGDQTINGKLATFEVATESKLAEQVFAKTSTGYLGKFTDQEFGYYEAGFLTQLHCTDNFSFPAVYNPEKPDDPDAIMVEDKTYRTELTLAYRTYFGDSLTASRLSVYRLDKNLAADKEAAYYTDINPEDFYPKNDANFLLGRKAYTAVDRSVKDSIRNLSGYIPSVTVTLPYELGQEIYKASREAEKGGKNFANIFRDLFKGIYVKNDYGDGTILYIDQIEMHIIYQCYMKEEDSGKNMKKYNSEEDSTYYSYRTFAATKEIIQANSFRSDEDKIKDKVKETGCTYLKTPAGIYTQATLPLLNNNNDSQKGILDSLRNDTLNVVRLTFTNYNQTNDKNKFSMGAPNYVLLVREKEKDDFFKKNKVNDDITSYIAQHNAINTNQYVFPNISRLINTCRAERDAAVIALANDGKIEGILDVDTGTPVTTIEAWEKATQWNKVALVPVTITRDQNTSTALGSIISVLNDLQPGYTKLKGGSEGDRLSMEVVYTSFDDKDKK